MDTTCCIFIGGKQLGVNCLKRLLEKNIRPQWVMGNPDDLNEDNIYHDSLLKFALGEKLEIIRDKKLSDPVFIDSLKKNQPEIIFCIGGTRLIPKEILEIPSLGCINIHPALLPKYRGRYSTAHAIINGEIETGVTLHWMDEGIDSGPIISQESIAIEPSDTAKNLWDNFTIEGEKLFVNFLELWLSGNPIHSQTQDESLATYYSKALPNEGIIDWSWSGEKIRNFIRAMTFEPFPPAQIEIGNKTMVIVDEKYYTGPK
jgi:methionyl-tRNA formyltransferase